MDVVRVLLIMSALTVMGGLVAAYLSGSPGPVGAGLLGAVFILILAACADSVAAS